MVKEKALSAQLMDDIDKKIAAPSPSNKTSFRKNKATSPSNKSALSVTLLDDDGDDEGREKKRGHKLFFFCCDTKRAVIVLNAIMLMVNIFTLTAAVVSGREKAEGYERAIVVRGCGMFVTFTTILGAYWYSKTVVLVGLAFACYMLTVAIVKVARHSWDGGDGGEDEDRPLDVVVPAVWYMLLFYAEAVFVSECNDGIMSSETYKRRERYSCCCNC